MKQNNTDQEAVKIMRALQPLIKKCIDEQCRSCVRAKKMTCTTAPTNGMIGVTDAFSIEQTIPASSSLNVSVGESVWCVWMFNDQSTMTAMWPGGIV